MDGIYFRKELFVNLLLIIVVLIIPRSAQVYDNKEQAVLNSLYLPRGALLLNKRVQINKSTENNNALLGSKK